jgi:hypothetical protein
LHFFALGALLFVGHELFVDDARTVTVTPQIRAELVRRFKDHNRRRPTAAEVDAAVRGWKRDEALYREALREGLDRDDATVRAVLADRMRARAALEARERKPTRAELDRLLAERRKSYEAPLRYDYEAVGFAEDEARELEDYERSLDQGKDARLLGRPIAGGKLLAHELADRLGRHAAERIAELPLRRWQRVEHGEGALLVRVNAVEGGLPRPDELDKRLLTDWSYAERQRAIEQEVQKIVDRYRLEDAR